MNSSKEFENIVKDILNNKEFIKLKNIKHHGISRYEHSLSVAKKSYKMFKNLNLDYVCATRAALLHDFFHVEHDKNFISRMKYFFIHPSLSKENSTSHYNLTKKQINIIESHMFPTSIKLPKSKEAIVVCLIDKLVALNDFLTKFSFSTRKVYNGVFIATIFTVVKSI
ncbi:MAG: HD domain-containing protein [Bacilli bacterium]